MARRGGPAGAGPAGSMAAAAEAAGGGGSSRHEKSLGLLTTKFVSLLQEAKDGVLDLKVVRGRGGAGPPWPRQWGRPGWRAEPRGAAGSGGRAPGGCQAAAVPGAGAGSPAGCEGRLEPWSRAAWLASVVCFHFAVALFTDSVN